MLHFFAKRMREIHEKDEQGQKGFTLIELLVVVIIIGILAAIAIPVFLAQRERAQQATCESDTRNAAAAATSFAAANNPDNDYDTMTTALLASDHGFKQTTGYTTVIAETDSEYTAVTTCAAGIGTAQFDSATGQVTFTAS